MCTQREGGEHVCVEQGLTQNKEGGSLDGPVTGTLSWEGCLFVSGHGLPIKCGTLG